MPRNLLAALMFIALSGFPAGLLAAPNDNASTTAKEKSSENRGGGENKAHKSGQQLPRMPSALPATDGDAAQALDEVKSNGSVDLQEVIDAVATVSAGRMLEIEPRQIGWRLYYDVMVIETGVVRHILVDARTGRARLLP